MLRLQRKALKEHLPCMKKRYYLPLLLLQLLFASCNPSAPCDCNNQPPGNEPVLIDHNLIGTWLWKGSSGGIEGETYCPTCSGQNIVLTFTPDSMMIKTVNGDTVINHPFHTSRIYSHWLQDSANVYFESTLDTTMAYPVYSFEENLLYLSYAGLADGFMDGYIRIE